MLRLITITLACSCFLSFIWAIKFFFVGRVTAEMKSMAACGFGVMVMHAVILLMTTQLNISAVPLYCGSLLLFWWAVRSARDGGLGIAFARVAPRRLLSRGAYRFIRHPFYASYMLAWIAGAGGGASWWLGVTAVIMFVQYWKAAVSEERQLLSGEFGSAYADYMQTAGMFVPSLRLR
jgi:protein-S-isoprenylcysteine O-methyltransferase Ste14